MEIQIVHRKFVVWYRCFKYNSSFVYLPGSGSQPDQTSHSSGYSATSPVDETTIWLLTSQLDQTSHSNEYSAMSLLDKTTI